ncbi:MAG TPA: acylneuraminate cytidylyltransferase family protein [Anaerolineaceae bacterium]|nr:acylneuraminate cytidylyltransferase family protein [Anaerolineaceae bacterium]
MTREKPEPRITALVPMRHHSQRVPGKNYRPLNGLPLYQHILTTLLQVPAISEIVVDTDSDIIIEGIQASFPAIGVINRPPELRADDISMNAILLHDINQAPADFYLQTHSTNPLLKPSTITRAINSLLQSFPINDSLFSVTRLQTRLYDQNGKAINHDPRVLLQTQDLPPVFEENSCIYLFSADSLRKNGTRIGETPLLFETDPEESWDIDEEIDFKLVEMILKARE